MVNPGTEPTTGTPSDDRPDEEPQVMHIRFEQSNTDRVQDVLAAVDRGETPEPYLERVYHDVDDLHRVTRPKNLELLQTLAREIPTSIRETARLVDRDVKQVHRNLEELEELGLVTFEDEGGARRPVVWYDEIAVELLLSEQSGRDVPVDEAGT